MPIKYYIVAVQVADGALPPTPDEIEEPLKFGLFVTQGLGIVQDVSVAGPFPQAGGLNQRGQVEVLKFTGHVRRRHG